MKKIIFFAFLAPVILSGCSTDKINRAAHFSVENLGAESSNKKGDDNVHYRTAVVLHGLAGPAITGGVVNIPGKKMPEVMSMPINTGCSQIIDERFDLDSDKNPIPEIQEKIDSISSLYGTLAALNLRIDLKSAGGKDANSLLEDRRQVSNSIKKEEAELSKIKSKNNVIILRWATDETQDQSLGFSIFGSGSSSETKKNGFLIAAGLRVSTLQPGDDFVRWLSVNRTGSDSIFGKNYIVTKTLSARYIGFRSDADIQRTLSVNADIDLSKVVAGNFEQYILEQKLKASELIGSSILAGASGSVFPTSKHIFHYRFWGDTVQSVSVAAEFERGKKYVPFYHVRAGLKEALGNKTLILSENRCKEFIPKNGTANIGYDFCYPVNPNDTDIESTADKKKCINLEKEVRIELLPEPPKKVVKRSRLKALSKS